MWICHMFNKVLTYLLPAFPMFPVPVLQNNHCSTGILLHYNGILRLHGPLAIIPVQIVTRAPGASWGLMLLSSTFYLQLVCFS